MKFFVVADTHFGHANIIKYCNRPFQTVEEMNKTMIKNWNETVSNKDIVLHLGDVGIGPKQYISDIVGRLNGKKILIMGNHDQWSEQTYKDMGFHTVSRFPIIYDDCYIMSHAPLLLSETTPYFNVYGHVHNDNKYVDNSTSKCVSVERIGYRPFLLYEKN